MAVKYNGRFIGVDKTPAYNNINGVWTLDQAAASAASYDWPRGSLSYVTDSLQIYLDASNTSSYSGSGTAWNDISGNNRNFTLVGSPTFNTANGGYIEFNGTNQYVSSTITTNWTNAISVGVWVNINGFQRTTNTTYLVNKISVCARTESDFPFYAFIGPSLIGVGIGFGTDFVGKVANTANYNNCDKWAYLTYVYDRVNLQIYVNGTSIASTASTLALSANSQPWFLCRPAEFYGAGCPTDGYARVGLSTFALYSKALSQAEITQNFNYGRGRFNV